MGTPNTEIVIKYLHKLRLDSFSHWTWYLWFSFNMNCEDAKIKIFLEPNSWSNLANTNEIAHNSMSVHVKQIILNINKYLNILKLYWPFHQVLLYQHLFFTSFSVSFLKNSTSFYQVEKVLHLWFAESFCFTHE